MIIQNTAESGRGIEGKLKGELKRLKRVTGLGYHLDVSWVPDDNSDRHGEVKGNFILIYDSDEINALRTLKHEFLDYLLTHEIIEPLVKQINYQKRLIESLVYTRKEFILERFIDLLDES